MNNIAATVINLVSRRANKCVKKGSARTGGARKTKEVHCLGESEKVLVKEALQSIEKNGVISGQEVIERMDKHR